MQEIKELQGKLEHSQVWEGNKGLPTAISTITPKPFKSLKMTILITPSFDESVQKKIQTDVAIPKEKSYFTRLASYQGTKGHSHASCRRKMTSMRTRAASIALCLCWLKFSSRDKPRTGAPLCACWEVQTEEQRKLNASLTCVKQGKAQGTLTTLHHVTLPAEVSSWQPVTSITSTAVLPTSSRANTQPSTGTQTQASTNYSHESLCTFHLLITKYCFLPSSSILFYISNSFAPIGFPLLKLHCATAWGKALFYLAFSPLLLDF